MSKENATLVALRPGQIDVDFSLILTERGQTVHFYKSQALGGKLKFDDDVDSGEMVFIVKKLLSENNGIKEIIVSPYYMQFVHSYARSQYAIVEAISDVLKSTSIFMQPYDDATLVD